MKSKMHPCADCSTLVYADSTRCVKCSNLSGEFNSNWKGGSTRHKKGYILRYTPGHPRLGSSKNKYVFEHILVMEEVIGRYLLPGENVHHKNGVHDDNRPNNLELWVTTQPAGQRPEDLVVWAKEILALYGGVADIAVGSN